MPKLRKKSAYTLKNEARKRKGIKLELCEPLNCRKEEIEGLESSTVDSTSKLENEKILETIYGKNLQLPFNYIIPRKITTDNLQNSLNDCHASTSKDISNSDTIKSSEKRKLWLLKKRQDPIYKSLQQKKDAERKQLKRKYPQVLQKESEYKKKMRLNPEVLQREKEHKQKIRKQPEVSQKERQHKRDIRQNPEVLQREKEHKQKIRKQAEVSQKERQHKRDIRQNPEVLQREKEHKQEIRKRPEVSQKERQHKRDIRQNPEVSHREKEHKQEIRKRPEVSQKERQHKRDIRQNPQVSQREKENKQEKRKRLEVSQKERQHKRDIRQNPQVSQREKEHKQEIRKQPEVSQKERQHKKDVRLNPGVLHKEKQHKRKRRLIPGILQKENQQKKIRLKANNIEELITKFHKIVTEGPLYICTCCKQLLYKKAVTETKSKPAHPLLVKVSGLRESYREDGIYYSVIRGREIIIVSIIVETDSDFIIDREYDEHKLNYYKIRSASKNNEGVYNWELKDNSKRGKQTGSFNITICDKERPEPVGESTPPLQYNRQDMDSILTIEENVLEVDGPGSPSLLDKAECVQDRNSPILSNNSNGANITSSEKCDNMPQKKIDFVEECKHCNLTLTEALNHHGSSYSLSNICHMLDPTTRSESHCWIGFVKFYGLMEGFRIKSIEYHKKRNPEDGHMQHILQELLPPLDFRVGHLTYYFSQKHSLREDVLLEIMKFHNNCKFCDICYKTAHSQSN